MTRTKRSGAPKWVDVKFDGYTLKLLDVSEIEGRAKRWPEIVLFQVPAAAKARLGSGNTLVDFLNANNVLNPQPSQVAQSATIPGDCKVWHLVVFHDRTCQVIVLWVPIGD